MSTPIKFKELTIRNFMSYGNNTNTVNLDFNEPVLIIGKNHDAQVEGQLDSNGAGKSAILDALAFAIYDKTISKKEKSELINNVNKKNLEVSVTFEKGGVNYKVIRMRKTKTKADVQLLIEQVDGKYKDKTPDSIANANTEIERIVGLPFDVFARIIVFSATFEPFLDLPSRHATKVSQTSIMEELFGYTELTEKAEALKENIKGVKSEFTHLKDLQEQINLEVERHNTQIENATRRSRVWDAENLEEIKKAKSNLKTLSKIDIEGERVKLSELESIRLTLADKKSEVSRLVDDEDSLSYRVKAVNVKNKKIETVRLKIEEIEETIDFDKELKLIQDRELASTDALTLLHGELDKITAETRSNDSKLSKLEKQAEHLKDDACPYCEQSFAGAKVKLDEISVTIVELNKTIELADALEDKLEGELADVNARISAMKKSSMFNGVMSGFEQAKSEYDTLKTQLDSYVEDDLDHDIEDKIEALQLSIVDGKLQLDTLISDKVKLEEDLIFSNVSELERAFVKMESLSIDIAKMEATVNPHVETVDELKLVVFDNDKSDKLNELEETLRHQEFLLKLLTKKDSFIRKNLLDSSLPFLNNQLMEYLVQLGLPHRVEFQPDMSAHISQFGTELSFTSLSSGQRARVNLALAFAFRDVLQATHGKISFCMLDECLDTGLGNVGVQLAAKMIRKIATDEKMSMLVISHRDEIAGMFKTQMVVELKDGFSNITKEGGD
jgi:DNA repair exonuclease SbcCD ATPase subunit